MNTRNNIDVYHKQHYCDAAMRYLTTILVCAIVYTFVHEALYHEGGANTIPTLFSHAGPEHHDEYTHENHEHRGETEHDSDHHDDDSHDHQFRILPVKKGTSAQWLALSYPCGGIAFFISDVTEDEAVYSLYHSTSQRFKLPLPGHLCAHVLRL